MEKNSRQNEDVLNKLIIASQEITLNPDENWGTRLAILLRLSPEIVIIILTKIANGITKDNWYIRAEAAKILGLDDLSKEIIYAAFELSG
jgi:hypothetical protein